MVVRSWLKNALKIWLWFKTCLANFVTIYYTWPGLSAFNMGLGGPMLSKVVYDMCMDWVASLLKNEARTKLTSVLPCGMEQTAKTHQRGDSFWRTHVAPNFVSTKAKLPDIRIRRSGYLIWKRREVCNRWQRLWCYSDGKRADIVLCHFCFKQSWEERHFMAHLTMNWLDTPRSTSWPCIALPEIHQSFTAAPGTILKSALRCGSQS